MSAPCLHCSGQVTPVGSPTAQPRPARWRGPCASVHRAPASTRRALRSWPPAGARPREQLPHGQRGALPAEVRQGPLPVPLSAAGTLFSQTGGRPGWVAGVLPAPGSSGQTPVEEPAGHTPGPDPDQLQATTGARENLTPSTPAPRGDKYGQRRLLPKRNFNKVPKILRQK